MITIDGSHGEGGGQVLRTSLGLSLVTGKAFHMINVRARRDKPGLMRQHLTALNAAVEVGQSDVQGNVLGSKEITFIPKTVVTGNHHFNVGSAGSCTLVLQTVLPALLCGEGSSELILEGGTHNPMAPPYDFLERAFVPLVNRMGPKVEMRLERYGFYPAGGGRIVVRVEPAGPMQKIELLERGSLRKHKAVALVSRLPVSIAERELKVLREKLHWTDGEFEAKETQNVLGPGNVALVEADYEHVTEVFVGFGQRGVPAERVAEGVAREAREYLESDVPVGTHLADQLLVPMALAGGGRYRTLTPTLHARTNGEIIQKFLDVDIRMREISRNNWEVEVLRQ